MSEIIFETVKEKIHCQAQVRKHNLRLNVESILSNERELNFVKCKMFIFKGKHFELCLRIFYDELSVF